MEDSPLSNHDFPSHIAISVKSLRRVSMALDHVAAQLTSQTALLDRLWYKSRAQHRRSPWFKSIDGLRRCLGRVLGKKQRSYTVEGAASKRGRSQGVGGQNVAASKRSGQSLQCQESLASLQRHIWSAGEGQRLEDLPSRKRTSEKLTDTGAPEVFLLQLASDVLVLAIQLDEISQRTAKCYAILEAHLRTPPAPTFAPLVASLVSVCAATFAASQAVLWTGHSPTQAAEGTGDGDTKIISLSRVYRIVIDAITVPAPLRPPLYFGGITTVAGKDDRKAKLLSELHSCGRVSSLPTTLERSAEADSESKQRQGRLDDLLIEAVVATTSISGDDEDIGEAV